MKTEFTKKFSKQVNKSADKFIKKELFAIIKQAQSAQKIEDIPKLKKLKGYKHTYRIRLGEYRIGIHLNKQTVIFAAFDHRSDNYKNFP